MKEIVKESTIQSTDYTFTVKLRAPKRLSKTLVLVELKEAIAKSRSLIPVAVEEPK